MEFMLMLPVMFGQVVVMAFMFGILQVDYWERFLWEKPATTLLSDQIWVMVKDISCGFSAIIVFGR